MASTRNSDTRHTSVAKQTPKPRNDAQLKLDSEKAVQKGIMVYVPKQSLEPKAKSAIVSAMKSDSVKSKAGQRLVFADQATPKGDGTPPPPLAQVKYIEAQGNMRPLKRPKFVDSDDDVHDSEELEDHTPPTSHVGQATVEESRQPATRTDLADEPRDAPNRHVQCVGVYMRSPVQLKTSDTPDQSAQSPSVCGSAAAKLNTSKSRHVVPPTYWTRRSDLLAPRDYVARGGTPPKQQEATP